MEENKYYQIYAASIMNLAGSLVIKSSAAAAGVNEMVYANALTPYDETDPTTWKYYQNICGIYYPSDNAMYITSMDTLEQVLFSKETLQYHRATARAYAFGTTYYKELVARYPDQEQLIRGILYPADMAQAIEAPDGMILAYPQDLVEETEPSFIPRLQEWIYGYLGRWHNVQYGNIDNLYHAAMLGVMYSMLPGAIENIRLGLCRTNEAHSYHVREYLSCNSNLGQFLPYMTRSQAMYFYRNLKYIQAHAGNNELFDELVQKCLTDRNLPLAHFVTQQDTENMPDELTPRLSFYKSPLNTPGNIDNRYVYTLDEVLDIQDKIVDGNLKYRDDLQDTAVELSLRALSPNVPTKLLQSTVIDYTDSERFRMADIVLNHWLWLSSQDYYRAYVSFTIPASGLSISLSAKDAFVFYAYALVKGMGYEMDKLPKVVANRVQRLKRVDLAVLQEVVPNELKSDKRLVEFAASVNAPMQIISLEAFRKHCEHLFEVSNSNYHVVAREEGMSTRAYLENASARLWVDAYIDLAEEPNQTYAEWFAARNIVVSDYNQTQLAEIASVILKEAIGANLASTITLKDIQNAMCSIILRLSSYSIQIDRNINTGPVIDVGQTQIRVGEEIKQTSDGAIFVQIPLVQPTEVKAQDKKHIFVIANPFIDYKLSYSQGYSKYGFDLPKIAITKPPLGRKSKHVVPIGVTATARIGPVPDNPRGLTIVPGMEHFLSLSLQEQQDTYVDTWARR